MSENSLEKNPREFLIPSYGRRRDRGLSASQKKLLTETYNIYGIELPKSVVNPRDFFENSVREVVVEIGFGHGEHLVECAKLAQDCGFIGCDPFENGVADALAKIQENNLKNVKIFRGDARHLLNLIEDNSIFRFYVLFPDPWTKNRHHKRRLLNAEFLNFLHQKTKDYGNAIIASDCREYMENVVHDIEQNSSWDLFSNDFNILKQAPACFVPTKYQQKALSSGKDCYYLGIYPFKNI